LTVAEQLAFQQALADRRAVHRHERRSPGASCVDGAGDHSLPVPLSPVMSTAPRWRDGTTLVTGRASAPTPHQLLQLVPRELVETADVDQQLGFSSAAAFDQQPPPP